jgi:hypothetical protein
MSRTAIAWESWSRSRQARTPTGSLSGTKTDSKSVRIVGYGQPYPTYGLLQIEAYIHSSWVRMAGLIRVVIAITSTPGYGGGGAIYGGTSTRLPRNLDIRRE